MKSKLLLLSFVVLFETSEAAQFEPLKNALVAALGTPKAFAKPISALTDKGASQQLYYSKDATGKAQTLAFVQKRLYPPNCTHTWVVGVDAKTAKVRGVRVVEMSCPHAFPTKESSYLSQYQGKGPAEAASLEKKIDTIAKATGTSNLTTDAVKRSIIVAAKLRGTF